MWPQHESWRRSAGVLGNVTSGEHGHTILSTILEPGIELSRSGRRSTPSIFNTICENICVTSSAAPEGPFHRLKNASDWTEKPFRVFNNFLEEARVSSVLEPTLTNKSQEIWASAASMWTISSQSKSVSS